MLCLLALALQTVISDASSAGSLRQTRAASKEGSARRLAYPSVGQLLTTPESLTEVDVWVHQILHEQCRDIFMRGHTKEQVLTRNLALNLTKYSLQSVTTNVDKSANKISASLTYANGSQAVYTEEYRSRSFGCTLSDPKYAGIMADAQSIIDGISYEPDMVLEAPERNVADFEELTAAVCDKKHNLTKSLLVYQKGKLVWEKYCGPGASKDSVETFYDTISDAILYGQPHIWATYWPTFDQLKENSTSIGFPFALS